jgi:hypothetical protein
VNHSCITVDTIDLISFLRENRVWVVGLKIEKRSKVYILAWWSNVRDAAPMLFGEKLRIHFTAQSIGMTNVCFSKGCVKLRIA